MIKASLRSPLLFCLMLTGAACAALLKPTALLAEQLPDLDLEQVVPQRIGEWVAIPGVAVQIVDPGQQELIDTLYTQTLNRAYRDAEGYVVMLSMAYGKDQRDALQLHKPEICYPSQGFVLLGREREQLAPQAAIPVTRMQTRLGNRYEPVTYWTTIGERVYSGGLAKKLHEMRYGFGGTIPDGMLVRVSSIDHQADTAFARQRDFALAMISVLPEDVRARVAGR